MHLTQYNIQQGHKNSWKAQGTNSQGYQLPSLHFFVTEKSNSLSPSTGFTEKYRGHTRQAEVTSGFEQASWQAGLPPPRLCGPQTPRTSKQLNVRQSGTISGG